MDLYWSTLSESDMDYFIVERTMDGKSFTDIQKVSAQGNSSGKNDYHTLDKNPPYGLLYYRIKSVEKSGKLTFSYMISVSVDMYTFQILNFFIEEDHGILIAVVTSDVNTDLVAEIYDYTGKKIYSKTVHTFQEQTNIGINYAPFPKGFYLLRVSDGIHTDKKHFSTLLAKGE